MDSLFHIKLKHTPKMFHNSGEDTLHVVTIGSKKYEIKIDHHIYPNKIEEMMDPSYIVDEKDFEFDAVFIESHTLRNVNNDPISQEEKERVLRLIAEHKKREYPNLEVTIE